MIVNKKTIRYYYWLSIEFIKKNLKVLILSFLLSFILLLAYISLSPFFYRQFFLQKKEIIGLIGKYDLNNLPDEIMEKISSGLVYIKNGQPIPLLASVWEIKNNGRLYRFHLKDGLLWNDGKPFLAYDVNYQFKDVKIKIIDEKTIDFYLDQPSPIFPFLLQKPIIRYPLIGVAGLYQVDKIKKKYGVINELTLIPNKKDIPILIYRFYPTESKMISAYKLGEVTKIKIYNRNIADNFQKWPNTKVGREVDYSQLTTILINHQNQFLKEKEVKRALTAAIPPDFYKDLGEPALGPIPPSSWAYNLELKQNLYNEELAKKIIKKNLSDNLTFILYASYDNYSIASELKSYFEKVDLPVKIKIFSFQKPQEFDFLLASLQLNNDPDQYFLWHSTQPNANFINFKNVKVDKLLEDGRNTLNVSKRKEIYQEYQKVITDDPPGLFLYYPYVYIITRK